MGNKVGKNTITGIGTKRQCNPLTPKASYGDFKVILTFKSVDEILQCDHSNDSPSAVLSHGTIYTLVFYKMKFESSLEF